jgi:hypothetical protein
MNADAQSDARRRADERQPQPLDHELLNETRPRSADGKTDGDLLTPARSAGDEQARNIGAGDEQHR